MENYKMNQPMCLIYSAAMVLDITPKEVVSKIGYTGMENHWPDLKGNDRLRGIHIQEIIDVAITMGKAFCPIEIEPRMAPYSHPELAKIVQGMTDHRFMKAIKGRKGILIGRTHACAWDGKIIHDPCGFTRPIDDYAIKELWLLTTLD